MKTPIVITTLEEDFKKIGLIKATPLAESRVAPAETEELAEKNTAKRHATVTRGGKKIRTKKMDPAAKRAQKKRRKGGKFKAWVKKYARKLKKFAKKIAKRAAKAVRMGTRKESVEARVDLAEALKAHANLAIISENLSKYFASVAEDAEAEGLGEAEVFAFLSEYLGETAEQVASVATSLNEGTEFDAENLNESFADTLGVVLDVVDLHEEMEAELDEAVDEEATDDEGMDEEEDDEEEDEEGND
jgi:hypothetical protein